MLDERLKAAADYLRKGVACVDVGTDHGYLSAYIYKEGITDKIIACDINEKPLAAAKKTFEEYKISDKIQLVLSNGLEKISKQDADDIIICGMGGELIMQIISTCDYARDKKKHFILQPMTNVAYLRRELYLNGFELLSEKPVKINERHYTVMLVCYCGRIMEISDLFAVSGKIGEDKSEQSKKYILHIIEKEKKIISGLKRSKKAENELEKHEKLLNELICLS